MLAVTTFSKSGYEQYAKDCLDSVEKYWPTKLIAYAEFPLEHPGIEVRDFFSIPGTDAFYRYLREVPLAHGKTPQGYNYNLDAWKFTRKVFAQIHVLQNAQEKVIWLDADTIVKKPVSLDWLENLFDGQPLVILDRPGFHSETGFVGFDPLHKDFPTFLQAYTDCLQRGILFTLDRWHDCAALDWARKQSGCGAKDLSPFFKVPTDRPLSLDDLDVFSKSVLSEFLDHRKGGKKGYFARVA